MRADGKDFAIEMTETVHQVFNRAIYFAMWCRMESCPPIGNRRWEACLQSYGRVTNPPQAASLHYSVRKITSRSEN